MNQSCTVYLWLPKGASKSVFSGNALSNMMRHVGTVGHAAMQIGGHLDTGKYVCWWPDHTIGHSHVLPGVKARASHFSAEDDFKKEKTRPRNKKINDLSMILRQFSSEGFSEEMVVNMFHENMLHTAMGVSEQYIDNWFERGHNENEAAFIATVMNSIKAKKEMALSNLDKSFHARPDFSDRLPWQVNIDGLDEQAMATEWQAIRSKPGAHYRLFRKNCATVVHRVLAAGGGDQRAGWRASHNLIWTPSALMTYCIKLQRSKNKSKEALY